MRILVVRLGAMGDVIHALPAAASLKSATPEARLTWAIEPRWAPLLEGNPYVDRVVAVRRKTAAGLIASWRELRSERYDVAVDLQGLMKSALTAAAARPERTFGFEATREAAAAVFYSDRIAVSAPHVVDRNLELAQAAGARAFVREFPLPAGAPEGDLPEGDYVLASPLAGWRAKQWPLENYARLAEILLRECGLPLVVNGPPGAPLADIAGCRAHYSGIAGLIHATRRAAAVVGVDSGPLHLAAALAKPGVAMFGPTDPARNGPYGAPMLVMRDARAVTTYKRGTEIDDSMRRVSPEQVFEALKDVLTRQAGAERA
jgi:heptosyltransferase I